MLDQSHIDHFRTCGYAVLPAFIDPAEVRRLRRAVDRLIERAPSGPGAGRDAAGRPVRQPQDFAFTRPGAGPPVLNRISAPLARSRALLRAYGNARLLAAAESLLGPDFVPFAESIVIKLPRCGAPFAWHQDGSFKTGEQAERGLNFGLYLHASGPANGGLWVLPGSHVRGRLDLQALSGGADRPPGAVPVEARAGDVVIHSRNLAHGSAANTAPTRRATVYFGFHARRTVEGAFTPDHIRQRMQTIPLAVAARNGAPYCYRPLAGEDEISIDPKTVLRVPPLAL